MKKLFQKVCAATLVLLGFSACIFQPKLYGSPPCLYGPPPEFEDSVQAVTPAETDSVAEDDGTENSVNTQPAQADNNRQ